MIEILHFIFQDFWHWAGATVLVCVICGSLSGWFQIRKTTIHKTEKGKGGV